MKQNWYLSQFYSTKYIRPTSACTRPPTALFFKGSAPAKALVGEASLAGPVSGDARRWAADIQFVYEH
jgi:hypothetical protein